jgi:hypothetical protein
MEQLAYSTDEQSVTTEQLRQPDWFRLGRDAVKVMARLSSMRELDFYLRHPEPFIRLHAIRRVAALLLPDAVSALAKRLEDPLENEQNRDEAGWAIRRICHVREIPWFAKTPWTDRYDGTETADSRYGVTLQETSGTGAPDELSSRKGEDGAIDEVLLRIQMEEDPSALSFSVLPWLIRNSRYLAWETVKGAGRLLLAAGKAILWIMRQAGRGMLAAARGLAGLVRKKPAKSLPAVQPVIADNPAVPGVIAAGADIPALQRGARTQSAVQPALQDPIRSLRGRQHHRTSTYRPHRHRKGGQTVFRLLFYPIRLVRHHWVFTLLVLISFYLLLGFSAPGRRVVWQLNPQAQRANDKLVAAVRVKVADYLGLPVHAAQPEAETAGGTAQADLAGSSGNNDASRATSPDPNGAAETGALSRPMARVAAPKGLNMRETPASTGEKIVWMSPGAEVVLLGITEQDAAGDLWQTVQYETRVGWAMDKWLAPLDTEQAEDGK